MAASISTEQKSMIKVGDTIPKDEVLQYLEPQASLTDPPKDVTVQEVFGGKKAVLFGLPGAYTAVCSSKHVPEYQSKFDELHQAGVQVIACASVNDAYVMREWGKSLGVDFSKIMMLADGEAKFHRKLGLLQYLPGLGERSLRYSMFLDDCVVKIVNVDEPGGTSYKVSGPSKMLEDLKHIKAPAGS